MSSLLDKIHRRLQTFCEKNSHYPSGVLLRLAKRIYRCSCCRRGIDWLKTNITSPLRVEELASRVQMSTPSFHQHFRKLVGMSQLRYQKWLRLNEAWRLMLNEHYDVTTAAYADGYESLSHFSWEYTRMFGQSPKRDITVLRKSDAKL